MNREKLLDIKKRSSDEKIDFLVDCVYDVQKSQNEISKCIKNMSKTVSDPENGLIPRMATLEKSKKWWTKAMWIIFGSAAGFLVVFLLKTFITSASAGS